MTNDQARRLKEAIVQAFSDDELKQFVRFGLGEDLTAIVGSGPRDGVVFELVGWARRRGADKERALVAYVQAARPGHELVRAITQELLGALSSTPPGPTPFLSPPRFLHHAAEVFLGREDELARTPPPSRETR